MGSLEFHEEKIKEILEAYKSSDSLFIKGICLFYFAVYLNHLQKNHNLESSLANLIIGNLDCLKNSQEKD